MTSTEKEVTSIHVYMFLKVLITEYTKREFKQNTKYVLKLLATFFFEYKNMYSKPCISNRLCP